MKTVDSNLLEFYADNERQEVDINPAHVYLMAKELLKLREYLGLIKSDMSYLNEAYGK